MAAVTNAADIVWIDVLPSLAGFVPALRGGLASVQGVAVGLGNDAGAGFGRAFGDSAATSIEAASSKVAAANKRLADAQGAVTVAQARLNDVMDAGNASSGRLAAAQEAVYKAERNVELQSGAVTTARDRQQRIETAVADATQTSAKRTDVLTGSTTLFGKAVDGANKVYGLMSAAMAISLPLAPLTVAIKSAGDFQGSMTKLVTTANAGQDQVKALGDGILKMAGQTGVGAGELAQGMYTVESSLSASETGAKRTSDALLILKASAEGAKQEGANLGNVVDAVTTLLHDYKMPASDAADTTSKLITAVSHGKLSFDDFTSALHSVTPQAANLHIPLADVAGSLAAMTSSGESAQQAAENMRNALISLAAPTQPMIDQLAQLGINSVQLSDDLSTKGLSGTMQEISNAITDKMGPAGKVLLTALQQNKQPLIDMGLAIQNMPPDLAKLSQGLLDGSVSTGDYRKAVMGMGGEVSASGLQFLQLFKSSDGWSQFLKSGKPDVQSYEQALYKATGTTAGLTVALQLSGNNGKDVNKIIQDVAGSAAQADGNIKGWADVQGNFNQKMDEAKASLGAMFIEAGQHLLPALTALAGWITDHMVPDIESFARGIADAWQKLKDFTAAHQVLMGTLGTAAGILTGVVGGFTILVKTVKGLSDVWTGLTKLVEINPFVAVVAGVAALAGGLIYAYDHSQTFRDEVAKLGDAFSFVVPAAKGLYDAVVSLVESGFKALAPILPTVVDALKQVLTVAENLGGAVLAAVVGAVKGLWDAFKGLAPVALDVAKGLISLYQDVLPALMVPLKLAVDAVDLLMKGFAAIPGPVLAVGGALAALQLSTHLSVMDAFQYAVLSVKDAFSGLAGGVSSAASTVVGKLSGLTTAYKDASEAGKMEAALKGAGSLQTTVSGMVSGVSGSLGAMTSSAAGLASKGFDVAKGAASSLMGLFGGPWGLALLAATGAVSALVEMTKHHNQVIQEATDKVTGWYKAMAQGGQPAVDAYQKVAAQQAQVADLQKQLNQVQSDSIPITNKAGNELGTQSTKAGELKTKINELNGELANGQKKYQDWYNALSPMDQLTQNVTRAQNDLQLAIEKYGPTSDQARSAATLYQGALSQQKLAQDQLNDSEKTEQQRLKDVSDAKLAGISSTLQAQQSDLQAKDALDQYNKAQNDGSTSSQQLAEMNNQLAQQIIGAAQAAGQAADDEAKANGVKDDTVQKNQAMIDVLKKYSDQLTGPAKDAINGEIGILQGVIDQYGKTNQAVGDTSQSVTNQAAPGGPIAQNNGAWSAYTQSVGGGILGLFGQNGTVPNSVGNTNQSLGAQGGPGGPLAANSGAWSTYVQGIGKGILGLFGQGGTVPNSLDQSSQAWQQYMQGLQGFGSQYDQQTGKWNAATIGFQSTTSGQLAIVNAAFTGTRDTVTGDLGTVQANINGPTVAALGTFSATSNSNTAIVNAAFVGMRDNVTARLADVQNNINGPTTAALGAFSATSNSNTGIVNAAFTVMRDTTTARLTDVQNNILGPTTSALGAFSNTSNVNTGIVNTAFTVMRDTTTARLTDVQNNINGPTAASLGNFSNTSNINTGIVNTAFTGMRDTTVSRLTDVQNNINGPMTTTLNALNTTAGQVTGSVQTAFNNMNTGVVGAVKSTVTNTSAAWNLMVPAVGNPVGSIVNDVLNNGLFKAFNAVSTAVAAPAVISAVSFQAPPTAILSAAAGGEIPGPYIGPTADNVLGYVPLGNGGAAPIRVNPREWIHPVDSVNYYGPDKMAMLQKRQISREALNAAVALDQQGVPGMADGGYVSGTWKPTPSKGQYLVGDKVARRTRHFLDALNAGQAEAVQAAGGWDAIGPRFFYGGAVDALSAGKAVASAMNGKPYVWGGASLAGADCSGFQSIITNALRGNNNPFFRVGTTADFPWAGFSPGLSGAYAVGSVKDAGGGIGHMAGTLAGVNVESGGAHNNVAYGGPAAGADAPLFNIHAYLPQVGGAFVSGGAGGGAGTPVQPLLGGQWANEAAVYAYLQNSYKAANDAMPGKFPPPRPQISSYQGVAPTEMQHGWDGYLKARVDAWFAAHPPTVATTGTTAGAAPANISGNVALGQQLATGSGWGTGPEWNSLYALWQRESGWNNLAQNPTSTAYGIPQFLDSTWATVGYQKTSDPATQIKAGLAYITKVYGDPNAAWAHETSAGWYGKGGQVNLFDKGGLWDHDVLGLNKTGGMERVLTPPQDAYFQHFVDTSREQLRRTAGPAQFNGDLYLDSGEFLGKVRGVAVDVMDARDAAVARDIRSAL